MHTKIINPLSAPIITKQVKAQWISNTCRPFILYLAKSYHEYGR